MAVATVDTQCAAVLKMAAEWPLIDALMAGTRAMRAAGITFLPKWPAEEEVAYQTRLGQATLFPAYARTMSVMSGKPFSRQLTLGDDTPAKIKEWCDDIDRQGTSLHVFAAAGFLQALSWGIGGILIDAPKKVAASTAAAPTMADQSRAGVRPYFVAVKHDQILSFTIGDRGRGNQLLQLRLKECSTEPDGAYGEKDVERVRVLEPGRWQVFRKTKLEDRIDWVLEDEGATELDEIPFVPTYGRKLGLMVGAPPLLDVAYQNVEHWQSKSDQQHILHVARVPILTIAGMDAPPALTVGGSAAVFLGQNPDAKMEFVEHSGAAIDAGRQSLVDLEARMIATGAELLVAKPGQRTATESANDVDGNKSDLQRIAEMYEDSLDIALRFLARMGGQEESGTVTLFKDFSAASLSDASAQLIVTMQQGGLIRKETAIREQQRRGVLSADIVPEDEISMAADEVEPTDDDGNGGGGTGK